MARREDGMTRGEIVRFAPRMVFTPKFLPAGSLSPVHTRKLRLKTVPFNRNLTVEILFTPICLPGRYRNLIVGPHFSFCLPGHCYGSMASLLVESG